MKKILFVCGTGGITSAVAEKKVVDACQKAGLDVVSQRCIPTAIDANLDDVDLIVSTTAIGNSYPVEVVNAIALIIGVGEERVLEQIVEKLR